jgi:hypothetical protein
MMVASVKDKAKITVRRRAIIAAGGDLTANTSFKLERSNGWMKNVQRMRR